VRAACSNTSLGLSDNWIRHVRDVRDRHEALLESLGSGEACVDRLCELNVIEQARNVCQTTIVQDAWRRDQPLTVHGWIYGLRDGLLRDLGCSATGVDDVAAAYAIALSSSASDT
jgi:carbonic anhydrase